MRLDAAVLVAGRPMLGSASWMDQNNKNNHAKQPLVKCNRKRKNNTKQTLAYENII